ncbi:MAG: O-methyltransferase [Calditrichaeota bacterium]|nr:O-methyltransferase [Calditrichota bacterium]
MMDIIPNALNKYLEDLLPPRDKQLTEMENYAAGNNFPIVGPQVGHLLFQLSRLYRPEKIFEMGSGFGYSAYWFARGAPESAITLTDQDENNLRMARNWLERGKFINRLEFITGESIEILRKNRSEFDFIFIDIDKYDYPEAFRLAVERVRRGGLIIIDNLLWYGRVLDPAIEDRSTQGVRETNMLLFQTPGIFSTLLPIRDGLGISLKL